MYDKQFLLKLLNVVWPSGSLLYFSLYTLVRKTLVSFCLSIGRQNYVEWNEIVVPNFGQWEFSIQELWGWINPYLEKKLWIFDKMLFFLKKKKQISRTVDLPK